MIPDTLEKILHTWQKLSAREQRLAIITAAVVAIIALISVYQRAQTRITDLNTTITRLEDDLVLHAQMIAHREMIESQYAAIAAQHSSEWSEAEIHDRLRQEIYRLARNTPPAIGPDGIPVPAPPNVGNIVEIPSLGKGQMADGGRGYREYRINLRIPGTRLANILEFLERLHNSPQSLRIDALDLSRSPESEEVSASIDISRIVADGARILPAAPAQSDAAPTDSRLAQALLSLDQWTLGSAEAQIADGALEIRAVATEAEAYMTDSIASGAEYEMVVNLSTTSQQVRVGVGSDVNAEIMGALQHVAGSGLEQQYAVRFSVPGDGSPVTVRYPWIQMTEPGAIARVSGLLLRTISEMYR